MNAKLKVISVIVLFFLFAYFSYTTFVVEKGVYITVFSSEHNGFDIKAQVNLSDTQQIIQGFEGDNSTYYLCLPAATQEKEIIFETGADISVISKQDGTYVINEDNQLYVLYGSEIPSVYISLKKDLSYITQDKSHVDSGHITFLSPEGRLEYTGDLDEIKGRGNTSWELDKKPFQMKLTRSVEVYDIPVTNEFVLVSARDYSFLRNKISNEIAKCLEGFTLSFAHVDLYINNEYQGIYELWNKLEPETLGITNLEESNKAATDTLHVSKQLTTEVYLDDWNNTVTGKWWDYNDCSENITGGYILEVDFPLRYVEEASGFTLDSGGYMVSKSPKYLSVEQYEYISEYIKECEKLFYEGINEDNYDLLCDYIDVKSFIIKYLVEEISKNLDCSNTSQYFYKDKDNVLCAGPVWDYDSAYGAISNEGDIDFLSPTGFAAKEDSGFFKWWQLLYYNSDFYNEMTYNYNHILYPYLDELTESLIPQWETTLMDSVIMNSLKWKRATSIEAAREEYQQQVDDVSEFIKIRKDFLYNEWN